MEQPPQYDPEQAVAEWADKVFLKPSEVEHVWTTDEPKQVMSDMVARIIKEKVSKHGSEWNRHSQFESRWEKAEFGLIAEYSLQALVFVRGEANVTDSFATGSLVNTFFDILLLFEKGDGTLRID